MLPLAGVFPVAGEHHVSHLIEGISIGIPIVGVFLAWLIYLKGSLSVSGFTDSGLGTGLRNFWHGGWGIDTLYDTTMVKPYKGISHVMRGEWLDHIYHGIVGLCVILGKGFSALQTGRMRWYATSIVFGLIVLVSIVTGVN